MTEQSTGRRASQPAFRLGTSDAWVAMACVEDDRWRVTADWAGMFTADFRTRLSDEEVLDFAGKFLAEVAEPQLPASTLAVTPERNNPLTLTKVPEDDDYVFYATLTPHGDDATCAMRMELGPLPAHEIYLAVAKLRDSFD